MSLIIRPAAPADVDAAAALWRLLQDEHEAADPRIRRSDDAEARWRSDFAVWCRSDAHGVWVAVGDDEVVGLLTAHPYWPAPVYEGVLEAYINEIIVREDWRGRGAGRKLAAAAREWARQHGIGQLRAGVLAVNPDALAFWRSVGADPFFTTVTLPSED